MAPLTAVQLRVADVDVIAVADNPAGVLQDIEAVVKVPEAV